MPQAPKLCVETSVVSYAGARASRDFIVLAHQQITRERREFHLRRHEPFISEIVMLEAEQGDPDGVRDRLDRVATFPVLRLSPDAERLAAVQLREMPLPEKALRDALHMAIASVNGMEYLITWNCRHIARGEIKRRFLEINAAEGIESPVIRTREELMGE